MKQAEQTPQNIHSRASAQERDGVQETSPVAAFSPPKLNIQASKVAPPIQMVRPFGLFSKSKGKKQAKDKLDEKDEKGEGFKEKAGAVNASALVVNDAVFDAGFSISDLSDDDSAGLTKAYNISGLTAMLKVASSLTSLYQSSQEAGNWSKFVEASFDLGSGLFGTASAISGMVSDYSGDDTTKDQASTVSTQTFVADSVIQSLKGSYLTIKKIVEAIKASTDKKVKSGHLEKSDQAKDIIGTGAQTIVATIKTIREILELAGVSINGWAQAVPIMGIAMAALDVAFRVYDLVKSGKALHEMQEEQSKLEGNMTTEVKGKKNFLKKVFGKGGGSQEADDSEANKEEYDFVSHMAYINQKRIARASIHIGLDLVKIGGEIAILTGVGAVGGVPAKAAASGMEVAMGIFRNIKQAGRDYAATKDDNSRWKNVFNTDKTTDKKNEMYAKDIGYLFSRISDLDNYTGEGSEEELHKKKHQVYSYIHASGAVPTVLFRTFLSASSEEKGMKKTVSYLLDCMKGRG